MLFIGIAGHAKYYPNETLANYKFSTCMFHVSSSFCENTYTSLSMHWAAFIPSNLLLGIRPV